MCVLGLKLETDIKSGGKVTWARVRGEVQFYSKASPQFLKHKLRHKRRIKNWFILRTKCHGLYVIKHPSKFLKVLNFIMRCRK